MKYKLLTLLLILTIIVVSVNTSISVPKKSSEPTFSDVIVTTSSSHLLLFGMLENSFSDEMEQGLHSGIPILFSFFVELAKGDTASKNNTMVSLKTHHLLSYDTLKDIYKVEIDESSKRFFSFSSLEEAKKVVSEINGINVIELDKLTAKVPYTIRLRAELYKKNLPLGLHQVVPFLSWWDIKTKWNSLTFTI